MALPRIYTDENAAREHLEALLWPNGPTCPHCGNADAKRITKLQGKSTRPGVYKCKECRKPFSVTVGTVFERSHIPLNQWVYAVSLLASSKKGISSHQIHRTLGVTYKTAWFMTHRIREAMRALGMTPLGGDGEVVEVDETYYGPIEKPRSKNTRGQKFTKGGKSWPLEQTRDRLASSARRLCPFLPRCRCRSRHRSEYRLPERAGGNPFAHRREPPLSRCG